MPHTTLHTLYGDPNTRAGLAESPLWDAQRQAWFWMDIDQHQIHQHNIRADNDATHRVWQLPLEARYDIGAIALADNGDLMLALRAGIASFNPVKYAFPRPMIQAQPVSTMAAWMRKDAGG